MFAILQRNTVVCKPVPLVRKEHGRAYPLKSFPIGSSRLLSVPKNINNYLRFLPRKWRRGVQNNLDLFLVKLQHRQNNETRSFSRFRNPRSAQNPTLLILLGAVSALLLLDELGFANIFKSDCLKLTWIDSQKKLGKRYQFQWKGTNLLWRKKWNFGFISFSQVNRETLFDILNFGRNSVDSAFYLGCDYIINYFSFAPSARRKSYGYSKNSINNRRR